ncbi:MAG: hypothetical protein HUJ29_06905 [Gammaproteobacteria bacterium]|nr:hypothetical protein [Gammaproteobacteria bacterium]
MFSRLNQFAQKTLLPLALIVLLVQLLPMHSHIHEDVSHHHDDNGLHFVLSDIDDHAHHANVVEPEKNGLIKQLLGKFLFALLLLVSFELGLTLLRTRVRQYEQPFPLQTRYHLSLPSRGPPH